MQPVAITAAEQIPGLPPDQAGNQRDTWRQARVVMSYSERYAAGKALREKCPRTAHAKWKAPANRPDAVDLGFSPMVETFGPVEMGLFAGWCGRALALSHARSGCSATLSGYMGKSDVFDKAIADFSFQYADQNEKDHAPLKRAIERGKVKAVFEAAR